MAYTDIDDPSAYFQTALYTGTGASLVITNNGNSDLKPDFWWGKSRSNGSGHGQIDSSRGITKYLQSSGTSSEFTNSTVITSFDTNGFTLGTDTSTTFNYASRTFVAWQWKANGGTATATISESGNNPAAVVQANPTAGFSIISYTGTGASGTIAHGLGATPEMYWIKNRDSSTPFEVFTSVITSGENSVLALNTTAAKVDSGVTLPTSTNITVTSGINQNQDGQKYIMYVFKNIQGYSKINTYIGNGNGSHAPFIYCGFKPAWVLVKSSSLSQSWQLSDSARNPFNVVNRRLAPNDASAESTAHSWIDFTSNGFKLRIDDAAYNGNDASYIYAAFAESPFCSSEGVPTTAR
tara:strand:+ start:1375 stop:2430 length:1056 start_codon:yes stop_codon:yes gene_type:complete